MAEVNATFNYDADFSSAISEVKRLSHELSVLNTSFNSLDKGARKVRDEIAQTFIAGVGDLGAFSAKTVDISSSMDHFGRSLDQGKLKLRDYYREATRAFSANSNAQRLATDQIRKTRSELVQLGIDPTGRNKGILVTPLRLDMSDMNNQMAVARKQFDIFNALVQGGATKLINFGKNTQWAGRQLTVGITVPMTIFASTVTKAFMDVDAELTRFQKVYGSGLVASTAQSTSAIRGQVTAMATDIAKQYGVAAKETAGLAADLAATGLEGQNLLDSLKQTTRLAVLGEVDRQTAMKATLAIQNAFKVNTKDLADNINFLNAVENQTSTSLQDLTEAIPKAGPVIKALGGDVKDLSLLLVAMKEGGIGVAEGANAIKSGLASLINPTKAASEAGKQYGINIEGIVKANKGQLMPTIIEFQNSLNTLDEFSKAQVIEKIFGKYQFARMSALFDNLNASGSQTQKVLELMGASTADLANIANQEITTLTESASMRFKRSMEAIRASLLPVGEAILKSVLPYLEKFSGFIDRVVQVGKNLPEPIKQFIKFGTAITAIAGPLVMIGGVLANFLGYVQKGAMGFVNLGRRMAGLPTKQFSLLDDEQIAAAKATDILTISIDKQKSAMIGLNALMKDYVATLVAQRAATPGAFNAFAPTTTVSGTPVVPKGAKTLPIVRRQSGGIIYAQDGINTSAWVPGSGEGDRVPALLEPGEFVINKKASAKHSGLLQEINSGTPRFQSGGRFNFKNAPGFDEGLTDNLSITRKDSIASAPPRIKSQTSSFAKWDTYEKEIEAMLAYAKKAGITLTEEQIKQMGQVSASHRTPAEHIVVNGERLRVWAGPSLQADSQWLNNYLNSPFLQEMTEQEKKIIQKAALSKHGISNEVSLQILNDLKDSKHPDSIEAAKVLIEVTEIDNRSNLNGGAKVTQAALKERIKGNYYKTIAKRAYRNETYYTAKSQSKDESAFTTTKEGNIKVGKKGDGGGGSESITAKEAFDRKIITKEQLDDIYTRYPAQRHARAKVTAVPFQGKHKQSGGVIHAATGITGPKPFLGVPTVKVNPSKLTGMGGVNEENPIAGLDQKSGMFYKQLSNNKGFNKDAMISEAVFSQIYRSGLFGKNVTGIDQKVYNAMVGKKTMPVLGSTFIEGLRTGDALFDKKSRQINKPTPFAKGLANKKAIEAMLAAQVLGNADTHSGNFGISNGKVVLLDNTANLLTDANGLQRRTSKALNDFSYSPDRAGLDRLGTQAYRKIGSKKADPDAIKYLDSILANLNSGDYVSESIKIATQGSPELLKTMNDYAIKKSRGASKTYEELVTSMIALRVEKMKSNLYVDEDNLTLADGGPNLRLQSGGVIHAMAGITGKKAMPEVWAKKLATFTAAQSKANAEAQAITMARTELGTRVSSMGGRSSLIPGVNGVYEVNGQRYVVKGHDTYESALAESKATELMRSVFGLRSPNQEVIKVKHPNTGQDMFAVRSPYDEAFAKSTGKFEESNVFDQIVASAVRRDKDLQSDNFWGDIVADVGQAGIMSKASQPREKTGATNGVLDQLAINLGMVTGGARSHGAEQWNIATSSLSDSAIANRIKESARAAKQRAETANLGEDYQYVLKDLDDIMAADLSAYVAHLRTVVPKTKKPPTEAALAKKEADKIKNREERQAALESGYPEWAMQSGGMIFAQDGAWVPGSGEGDRVPAMLEPGEFVVNKKAAMKHGGLLSHLNWVDAPRFAQGTPGMGMKSATAVGSLGMVTMMLPQMMNMSEGMAKVTTQFTGLAFALQAVTSIMMTFGKGMSGAAGANAVGTMSERAAAKRSAGMQMISGSGTAASRRGAAAGVGRAASGAKMLTSGLIMNPIGLGVVAAIGLAALAVYKYRQEIEKAKKAAQESFSAGEKTAQAYGIEIQNINDKLKENQEITNKLGLAKVTSVDPNAIGADKMAAIKEDNKNLIASLNDINASSQKYYGGRGGAGVNPNGANSSNNLQQASMLRTKFATLRQQGFSQRDAMEVLTGIAKEAGTETQNVLYSLKPELIKITGETQGEVFKSAQDVQLEALKNTTITSVTGSSEAFRESFKGIMQSVQYAAPEDQYKALENVIKTINTLDSTQIKQASEALVEAATADYGSADSFTQALTVLQKNGDKASLATAASLDAAKRLGIDTGYIETRLMLDLPPGEVAALKAQLDEATKQRSIIVELQVKNSEKAQKGIDSLTKSIEVQNAKFNEQMDANDNLVEKENKRYANAGKLSAKFIKGKQKEIESINKGADTYIQSLERESKKDEYLNSQRKTALSGLQALSQGDVLGFLASKQEGTANAQQYSYDQEIQQIDDKRKAAVDALQTEIDKENDKQANADENHQKRLDQLEKEREASVTANSAAVNGLQDQIDAYASLQSQSGAAFDSIIGNYQYAATEGQKTAAVTVALNYLLANPNGTVAEAIAAAQSFLQNGGTVEGKKYSGVDFETAREDRRLEAGGYADGGPIYGAGGPTDDKIPAMLSNGEYVVKASAVDQYGVGMLDQINTQKFATGGIVNFRGKRFDQSTVDKILLTEEDLKNMFSFYQGSYNQGVSASAGTHDGGGVFDVKTPLTSTAVTGLRKRGFAAWMRSANVGGVQHIHALEIGNPNLSPAAARQVQDYLGGGDGLRGGTDNNTEPTPASDALNQIATAMGTTAAIYNDIKTNGLGTVLTGRRFGGSMTMNKPYMVGENGPEVVTPYGHGGRVSPIRYNVPASAMSPELMEAVSNTSIANSSNLVYNINVDAAGMTDPRGLAKYIVSTIRAEENARSFGRKV